MAAGALRKPFHYYSMRVACGVLLASLTLLTGGYQAGGATRLVLLLPNPLRVASPLLLALPACCLCRSRAGYGRHYVLAKILLFVNA